MSRKVVLALALYASGIVAAETEQGRALYYGVEIERTIQGVEYTDANCETCHGEAFYTRADRKVHSYRALEAFVEGCSTNLDVGWFPDEVEAVAAWMNKTYYRFEE